MAGIIITSDANFIEIDFDGKHQYLMGGKFRKSLIGSVCCLKVGEGVQIVTHDTKPIIIKYTDVASVAGDEDVTSDPILCNMLKALM